MPTIDNEVVRMTFENKQFERGVQQSVRSLEELKKALDLDKSAASLANLEKAAANFDLSGIASGVDKIADKFTLLGNIGQEIFHRISKTAVDAMASVWRSITSMPTAGMGKYEEKNKAVQMIQSALPDKSIEEIETVLGKLNDYTDLTSYDFSQMAKSIGKFTSAGVDLDVAERAMEGIANETASAGGEIAQANIAMYNFSQALATGAVRLMDWRSIENANLGTKEFKEQIIETAYELGTLGKVQDKVGKTTKGTTVTFENMAQTLQEGWFTSDVLIKVLEKYADRESDVGKKGFEAAKIAITLKQALDAVKDAVSTGWMQSFEYIFGNLEEAGKLFTMISDSLIEFTDRIATFRNNILGGWHTGGEDGISGYTLAVEALSSAFSGLNGIAEATSRAFENVFGVLDGSGLIKATQDIRDLMGEFEAFFGFSQEEKTIQNVVETVVSGIGKFNGNLERGAKGDAVKTMQQLLLDLGMDMVKLDKYGADGIFGPETQAALKAFQESVNLKPTGVYDKKTHDALAKALYPNGKVIQTVEETTETIEHVGEGLELVQKAAQGVFSVAKAGLGIIKFGLELAGKIAGMLMPVANGVISLTAGLGDLVYYVTDLTSSLLSGEEAMGIFNTVLSPVSAGLEIVGGFLANVGAGITNLVTAARSATSFEELGNLLQLDPVKNAMAIALYNILVNIKDVADKVAPAFSALGKTLSSFYSQAKAFVKGEIASAWSSITQFFTNLWSSIEKGDYLTKILNGLASALQVVLGIVGGVGYGIFSLGSAVVNGAKSLYEFIKSSETVQNFLASIKKFFAPVGDFFTAFGNSLGAVAKNLSKFKSFTQLWNTLLVKLKQNPLGKKFVEPLNKIKKLVEGPIKKIKEFIGAISTAFATIRKFKNPGKALDELMKDPEKNKGAINVIKFLGKIVDLYHKIMPAVGNIKSSIASAFGKIGSSLKTFGGSVWSAISNFFNGDDRTLGQRFADFFTSLWESIKVIWGQFTGWLGNLVKSSPFLSSIYDFGKLIAEAFGNFFSVDTSGEEGIFAKLKKRFEQFNPVIDWIKEKISALKEAFNGQEGVFAKVREFFSTDENSVLSVVATGIKKMWGAVTGFISKNVTFDNVGMIIGGWVAMTVAGALKNFGKSAAAITGATKKDKIGDMMLKMAVSIVAIAGAIALLANIDAGKALAGVGVMAVALGAVVGAAVLIDKFAKEGLKNAGIGLAGIAASIGLTLIALWGASKLLDSLKGKRLTKSLLLVATILVTLTTVAALLSKFGGKNGGSVGGAATVLAIAASISLVVDAIGKAAKLLMVDYENQDLSGPILMVGGILVALGAVAVLMAAFSKDTSTSSSFSSTNMILALAYAVSSIVGTVGKMAETIKQYPEESKHAFWMVEGLLGTVGAIAVLLEAFSTGLEGAVSGLVSREIIKTMGDVIKTIAQTMANCITQISGVNPDIVKTFMIGVNAALVEVGAVAVVLSKIPFTSMLSAAGSLFAVITAIGAGVGVGSMIASDGIDRLGSSLWSIGVYLEDFSGFMENVKPDTMEKVVKSMCDTILPAVADFTLKSGSIEEAMNVMKNLKRVGTRIMLFSDSVSGITADTGSALVSFARKTARTVEIIKGIQGVSDATSALNSLGGSLSLYYGNLNNVASSGTEGGSFDIDKANEAFQNLADLTLDDETLQKIKGYATDGDQDLSNFAAGIENLGTALKGYGDKISTLDGKQISKANRILDKVSGIQTSLNGLSGFRFNILSGKRQDISDFGDDIAELGTALSSYANNISSLDNKKIKSANAVLDAVSKLNTLLPETGGLWQMLAGEKKLNNFASNMSLLGEGMALYAQKIKGADFTKVDASLGPVRALADIYNTLNSSGGINEILNGSADIGKLGTNLATLGQNLYAFATAEQGIKDIPKKGWDVITKALDPIAVLAEAQSKMNVINDFSSLGQGLDTFSSRLIQFNNDMSEFVLSENADGVIDILERVANMAAKVNNIDNDSNAFAELGNTLYDVIDDMLFAIDGENGNSLADRTITAISGVIDTVTKSIASDTRVIDTIAAAMNDVLTTIEGYDGDFNTVGRNIDAGLAQGIYDNRSAAINAAALVAARTLNRALQVLDIQSPSKEFAWAGLMSVTGLANGLVQNSGMAENAAEALGETTIAGIRVGLGQLKSIIENGVSDDITITPVLDLSQVTSQANRIGGLLNGHSIRGSLNLANDIQTGNGVTVVQRSGGSSSPDVVAAVNALNERMDSMAHAIAGLRLVFDTGVVAGALAGPIDQLIGTSASQNIRRR